MSKRTSKKEIPLTGGSAENIQLEQEQKIEKSRLKASQTQKNKKSLTLKQQGPKIKNKSKRTDKKKKPLVSSVADKIKLQQEKKIEMFRLEALQEQNNKELMTIKQQVPNTLLV